jgi:hypothetical protein
MLGKERKKMIRINLLPNWRNDVRKLEMAKELCTHSLIFMGLVTIGCLGLVLRLP